MPAQADVARGGRRTRGDPRRRSRSSSTSRSSSACSSTSCARPIAAYLASRGRADPCRSSSPRRRCGARRRRSWRRSRSRLAALPAELDALKRQGAEDVDGRAGADRARQPRPRTHRLLEQTRREIDMRLRIARRELTEHAAQLAVRSPRADPPHASRPTTRCAWSIATRAQSAKEAPMTSRGAATRYARALFDVAQKEADIQQAGRELAAFARARRRQRGVGARARESGDSRARASAQSWSSCSRMARLVGADRAKLLLMLAERDRLVLLPELSQRLRGADDGARASRPRAGHDRGGAAAGHGSRRCSRASRERPAARCSSRPASIRRSSAARSRASAAPSTTAASRPSCRR